MVGSLCQEAVSPATFPFTITELQDPVQDHSLHLVVISLYRLLPSRIVLHSSFHFLDLDSLKNTGMLFHRMSLNFGCLMFPYN